MKIKELFSDPSKWAQGHYGLTAEGDTCFGSDPDAVCFCLSGAVSRILAFVP